MLTVPGILFYLLIFTWLINRRIRKNNGELNAGQIAAALGFKTLAGCAYGYIFLVNYQGDDTWQMHAYSIEQQSLLLNDPLRFLLEPLPAGVFGRYQNLSADIYYYLHDLEAWLLAKPFAIVNFITGANYYINIVFFSAFTFWGQYWLFRALRRRFRAEFLPLFLCIFFVPPVTFWLSGLRAEGPLLFFLMLLLVWFEKILREPSFRGWFAVIAGLAGLVILRSAFAVLIVPALAAWVMVEKSGKRPLVAFVASYGICVTIFLGSGLFSAENGLTAMVAKRQQSFFELEANTRFELGPLSGDPVSFILVAPRAIMNTFLRPFPWEAKGLLQLAASLEMLMFWLLVLLFFFRRTSEWRSVLTDPLTLSLLCFAAGLYLLTGFTVPFPGAIVRYKIVGELFFLAVLTCLIRWKENPEHTL